MPSEDEIKQWERDNQPEHDRENGPGDDELPCGCVKGIPPVRWSVPYRSELDSDGARLTVIRTWTSEHNSTCDVWYKEQEEAGLVLEGLLGLEFVSAWGADSEPTRELITALEIDDLLGVDIKHN